METVPPPQASVPSMTLVVGGAPILQRRLSAMTEVEPGNLRRAKTHQGIVLPDPLCTFRGDDVSAVLTLGWTSPGEGRATRARSIGELVAHCLGGSSVRAYLLGALAFSVRVSQRECFVGGRSARACLGPGRESQAGWFRPGWIWQRLGARAPVVVERVGVSGGSRALRDGWPAPRACPGIGDGRPSWVDFFVGTAVGAGRRGRSGPGWS